MDTPRYREKKLKLVFWDNREYEFVLIGNIVSIIVAAQALIEANEEGRIELYKTLSLDKEPIGPEDLKGILAEFLENNPNFKVVMGDDFGL